MPLTILNVAFPLAPVGEDASGGAEQVLAMIDEGLVRAGHRSLVIACTGSRVAGTLLAISSPPAVIDGDVWCRAHEAVRRRIAEALARWPVDAVHFHGIDFDCYWPDAGVPALVTLHLPPDWYRGQALRCDRPRTWFNAVSTAQHSSCPSGMRLLDPISNGVALDALSSTHAKRRFALALGRICPEKGFHLALDAARRAQMPLLLARSVSGFPSHQAYFQSAITPRLDAERRFLGPVGLRRKRRLLSAARCLLVPSQVAETSSLVAMEALACGTPVIAFRIGALPEIIDHGRTGFLVEDESEMADALALAARLSSEECRDTARRRFPAVRMVEQYIAAYARLAQAAVEANWRRLAKSPGERVSG